MNNRDNESLQHGDFIEINANSQQTSSHAEANPFQMDQRLTPNQVYYSAKGLFLSLGFKCIDNIVCDDIEVASLYKRYQDDRLHILYYPGKDNDKPLTPQDTSRPLRNIFTQANKDITNKYGDEALIQAKKIFVVAESNTYYGIPITHYIKGDLAHGVLSTVDSIDRNYDESYVDQILSSHKKRKIIKTGRQNRLLDNWSCGHHALHAIECDLKSETITDGFKVTPKVIAQHFKNHELGLSRKKTAQYFDANVSPNEDKDFIIETEQSYVAPEINNFIEITGEEQKHASHMYQICSTGRNTLERESEVNNNKDAFNFDVNRKRILLININEDDKKMISAKHQQDLFTAPTDLIKAANPLLNAQENETTKTIIYKNSQGEIIADCLLSGLNLNFLSPSQDTNIKDIHISGQILFRYQWINNNWQIQFMGASTSQLKKLLLGQYQELDDARKLDSQSCLAQKELDIVMANIRAQKDNDENQEKKKGLRSKIHKIDQDLKNIQPKLITFLHSLAQSEKIPVGGKIGEKDENCMLFVNRLEQALQKYTKDKNLKIETSEKNNIINLKIYTTKQISLFDKLNFIKAEEGYPCYHFIIDKNCQTQSSLPNNLFEIYLSQGNNTQAIDVSHLFTAQMISSYQAQSKYKESVHQYTLDEDNGGSLLSTIRSINKYLTQKAKGTSILKGSEDYYLRRGSFRNILIKLQTFINKQDQSIEDLNTLKKFISHEAKKFKPNIFLSFFQRNQYYQFLIKLNNNIDTSDDLINLGKWVNSYTQLYAEMDFNKSSIKKCYHSFFRSNAKKEKSQSRLFIGQQLYRVYYERLDNTDKECFLNPKEAHAAECRNFML